MTTATMEDLQDEQANVVEQLEDAKRAYAECEAAWRKAAGKGDTKAAEKLEGELDVLERRTKRLETQCDAVAKQVQAKKASDDRAHRQALTDRANEALADLNTKLDALGPLAEQMAGLVAEVKASAAVFREARIVAKQAGATVPVFGSESPEARQSFVKQIEAIRGGAQQVGRIADGLAQDNWR